MFFRGSKLVDEYTAFIALFLIIIILWNMGENETWVLIFLNLIFL